MCVVCCVRCLLFVAPACCLLLVVCCVLCVVRCALSVAGRCLLFVVCWWLVDVGCAFVVCCLVFWCFVSVAC